MQNKNIKICCFCAFTCIYLQAFIYLFIHVFMRLVHVAARSEQDSQTNKLVDFDRRDHGVCFISYQQQVFFKPQNCEEGVVGELQYFQALLALIEKSHNSFFQQAILGQSPMAHSMKPSRLNYQFKRLTTALEMIHFCDLKKCHLGLRTDY